MEEMGMHKRIVEEHPNISDEEKTAERYGHKGEMAVQSD
jgi:hypothetical protein